MVMARMPTGFAVIGDTQQLPGYCVLLYEDAMIDHLTDLPRPRRAEFLLDLSLLGEALETAAVQRPQAHQLRSARQLHERPARARPCSL